ncbi:MAG TPA: PRC-barrel domain-containing protein [Burkholderiales bacterium]
MKFAKPFLISFSLLAFAGAAQAQSGQQQGARQQLGVQQQSQQKGEMRTSELIGQKVKDSQGKELGEIKDVVLDLQGGKVHAAVLEFGGFMGVGEKNFAFPLRQLEPGGEQGQLTMNIDKQKLENAEGFAQGQWPAMDDEYWGRIGGQASTGETRPQGEPQRKVLVRASELDGKTVQDNSGQDVGEIRHVMVDMKSGQLRDIVVDVKDAGQARVQASSLSIGTGDKLVLDMDAGQLKRQGGGNRQ